MAEPTGSQMPTAYDDSSTLLGDLIDQRNFTLSSALDQTQAFVHASFPSPANDLNTGVDLQEFRVLVRPDDNYDPAETFQVTIELMENGNSITTLISNQDISGGEQVISALWDASLLSNITGAWVEVRVTGDLFDVGAIEWNADTTGGAETLSPDGVITSSKLSGSVADIQDDPDTPDANWMTYIPDSTIPILGDVTDIEFPVYLKFDSGEIVYSDTPKSDNKGFDNCLRGVRGSGAQTHANGGSFYLNLTGQHLNLLKKGVIAGQKYQGLVGLGANLPVSPSVNEIYIATDTQKVYVCLVDGAWTWLGNRDDHVDLDDLGVDDHAQYHNDARAQTWHDALSGGHVQDGDTHDHGLASALGAGRVQAGLEANLPSPPNYEREIFYATDTNFLYISVGTTAGDFKKITGAPSGTVAAFLEADITNLYSGACPTGWSRFTALDGNFARGAPTGVTSGFGSGGALTHAHTYTDIPSHTHTVPSDTASTSTVANHSHSLPYAGGGSSEGLILATDRSTIQESVGAADAHSHSITISSRTVSAEKRTSDNSAGVATGNTSSENHLPPYQEVIFCIKD